MPFLSWAEFWAMGGHALYVWLSFSAFVGVLALNMLSPSWLQAKLCRQERRRRIRARRQESSS